MGQSVSNNQVINSNHETFTINIKQFKVQHPDFSDLKEEFRNRFCLIVWNQLLWTINESIMSYKTGADYVSWKSAFNAIYGLKISVLIICFIPFLISSFTILICLFLFFMSLFLTATGVDNSFYIYSGTYNMLSISSKYVVIGCFIMTFIGIIILYFTQRSLNPLKKTYTMNMAKYIATNLQILSKVYDKYVLFEMKWIRINNKLFNCKCGECGIQLIANIKIIILKPNINAIEDIVVMDAFNVNPESSQSQNYDIPHDYNRGYGSSIGGGYGYYPVEGPDEGDITDIQTEISIEIIEEH